MKTEITNVKSYEKKISFEISAEDMQQNEEKTFQKVRKTAKISGFRPGKAPVNVVRAKYANMIHGDTIEHSISEAYSKFMTENREVYPISQPKIEDINYNKGEVLTFSAIIEVYPEFDLKDVSGIEGERLTVKVEDSELEDAIMKVRRDYGSSKSIDEPIKKGSIVKIKIKQKDMPDDSFEEKEVVVGEKEEDEIDNHIVGMKKGEEKIIPFTQKIEGSEDKTTELDVKILDVKEETLPEFNDEFVKSIDKKIESADDFSDKIKQNLFDQKKNQSENQLMDKIMQEIVKRHDNFDVPPSVLNKYIDDIMENAKKQYGDIGIDPATLRGFYEENAAMSLKWEYIKHKIVDAQKLQVTEADTENKFKEISDKLKMDIDKVKGYYSGQEKLEMFKRDLLEEKIKDYIFSISKLTDVEKLTVEKVEEEVDTAAGAGDVEEAEVVEEK